MPEVHVQKQLSDKILSFEEKAERIDELRRTIEGELYCWIIDDKNITFDDELGVKIY
jgi:hypothetical protein